MKVFILLVLVALYSIAATEELIYDEPSGDVVYTYTEGAVVIITAEEKVYLQMDLESPDED